MEFAAAKHRGQFRKNPTKKIPYISHPALVGLMLTRAGYNDEIVAAGILHDVIEDCGVSLNELRAQFGPKVARLVDQVSEPSKIHSWEFRKQAYRAKLEKADVGALAIAAADHLHNLQSLLDVYSVSRSILRFFKTDMETKYEHETLCLRIIKKRLKGPLVKELEKVLVKTKALSSKK